MPRRCRIFRHRHCDDKRGEAIKVLVVKNDPPLTDDDLSAYCKQQFTGYKRPNNIKFRDDLPNTNIDKILGRELRTPG